MVKLKIDNMEVEVKRTKVEKLVDQDEIEREKDWKKKEKNSDLLANVK